MISDTSLCGYAQRPSMAIRDSTIHVAWVGETTNYDIWYRRSIDNGNSWDLQLNLTNHFAWQWEPSIAIKDSIVHIVWWDGRNATDEIYYRRSTDNGVNWETEKRLTFGADAYWGPSIAVRDSIVHVVWADGRDGNTEIYYKRSQDNGSLWYSDERLTNASGKSFFASVACWDCPYDVHVTWTDERDGNQEIYYKRHECEPSGIEERKYFDINISSYFIKGGVIFKIESGKLGSVSFSVFDITGRLINRMGNTVSTGERLIWKRGNKSPGVYFFIFEIAGRSFLLKRVIF